MKTIKDYLAEGNTYESLQGKAILCHGEIQYISNNFFTKEEIADYYEGLEDRVCSEEAKYKMRLYGGDAPDSKLVNWIYTQVDQIASESDIKIKIGSTTSLEVAAGNYQEGKVHFDWLEW